jgi:hypothetical protein
MVPTSLGLTAGLRNTFSSSTDYIRTLVLDDDISLNIAHIWCPSHSCWSVTTPTSDWSRMSSHSKTQSSCTPWGIPVEGILYGHVAMEYCNAPGLISYYNWSCQTLTLEAWELQVPSWEGWLNLIDACTMLLLRGGRYLYIDMHYLRRGYIAPSQDQWLLEPGTGRSRISRSRGGDRGKWCIGIGLK